MNYKGEDYFYVYNLQGDVVGLLDSSGQEVVSYQYDTWGNEVSITGTKASTVGEKNPYRYRGYRYDSETGLYYLNARYYNPEWGRMLNADSFGGFTGELLSHNVYAYVQNNPVMYSDPTGYYRAKAIGHEGHLSFNDIVSSNVETTVDAIAETICCRAEVTDGVAGAAGAITDYIGDRVEKLRHITNSNGTIVGIYSEEIAPKVKPNYAAKALGPTATALFVTADLHATINNNNLSTGQKWGKGTIIVIGAGVSYGVGATIGFYTANPLVAVGVASASSFYIAKFQNWTYGVLGLDK
jgi:RHS repeat-associated protein